MTIKYRPATDADLALYIVACPEQMVRHDRINTIEDERRRVRLGPGTTLMRCHVVDGVPKVASGPFKGERLAGSYGILPSGREVIHDLRIAGLPAHIEPINKREDSPTPGAASAQQETNEPMKQKKRKLNFLLPEPMCRTLREHAEAESARLQMCVTVSDVVRRAIHDMIVADPDLKASYDRNYQDSHGGLTR